ncbi:MAG: acyl-CoA thioesterase [Flavobacteriales bacterium]
MKKSTTTIRVRYGETDAMGIVYYGNYALYFEQGRSDWLRELGYTYKWMEENNIQLPIVNLQIEYKHPARYDDLIYVHTFLKEMPTVKIELFHEIYNQENKLLVKGSTKLVFRNSKSRKIIKCPNFLIEKIMENYFL